MLKKAKKPHPSLGFIQGEAEFLPSLYLLKIKVMNTKLVLWKVVINLPESLKTELLHSAEYLQEKYPNHQPSQEKMETVRVYGSWAGQIIMSDDFDEPLEDLAEYM